MKTQNQNVLSERQNKLVKRWMIAVTAVYGFMLIGTLGVIATSDWSGDNSEEPGITTSYDGNAIAAPTFQPGRMSQLLSTSTDGHNKAMEPMASANVAPPARVPVPEVDEMAEVFPERAHPSSQASAVPPRKDRTRWSRTAGTSTIRTAFLDSLRCRSPMLRPQLTGAGSPARNGNLIGERFTAHLMLQPPIDSRRDRSGGWMPHPNTHETDIRVPN